MAASLRRLQLVRLFLGNALLSKYAGRTTADTVLSQEFRIDAL